MRANGTPVDLLRDFKKFKGGFRHERNLRRHHGCQIRGHRPSGQLPEPYRLLGEVQKIQAAPGLVIVNLFGQLYYGNAEKTHRVYTDPNALTEGIQRVLDETNETVFIPGFIGCGLAGYDWTKLKPVLKQLRGSERLTAIYKARIQKGFGAATPPRWDI